MRTCFLNAPRRWLQPTSLRAHHVGMIPPPYRLSRWEHVFSIRHGRWIKSFSVIALNHKVDEAVNYYISLSSFASCCCVSSDAITLISGRISGMSGVESISCFPGRWRGLLFHGVGVPRCQGCLQDAWNHHFTFIFLPMWFCILAAKWRTAQQSSPWSWKKQNEKTQTRPGASCWKDF